MTGLRCSVCGLPLNGDLHAVVWEIGPQMRTCYHWTCAPVGVRKSMEAA